MSRIVPLVLFAVVTASCASSTGAVPRPFPVPGGAPSSPRGGPAPAGGAPTSAPRRADTVFDGYSVSSTALSLRGAPYRNGGADPTGFDCSGFVQYVFAQHGKKLPREVRQLYSVGHDVNPTALEPGDLLFFTTVAPGASHVAIAVGGDQFVHAPSTSGVVRVENLSAQYWANRFVGAKRVN